MKYAKIDKEAQEKLDSETAKLFDKIRSDFRKLGNKIKRVQEPECFLNELDEDLSRQILDLVFPTRLLITAIDDVAEKINERVEPEKVDSYQKRVRLAVYNHLLMETLPEVLGENAIKAVRESLTEEERETESYIY